MLTEAKFTVKGSPVVCKQRALSAEMLVEFEKQIEDMLVKGVIRPSKSEWGTVPVFVQKKEGTWRMALDYRRLNQQLVFDAYPIPRPWDMVKALVGHKFYTALDANWGFWNLRVHEDSKKYTAILTPWGLYEFNVLPFGIKNSPGEFQRAMDTALRGCRDFVHCYIDDMSFGADDETTHFERLRRTLEACRLGGVYLKIEKAHILQRKVCILGHMVSEEGVQPDPKKINTIKNLLPPQSVKEVRSFVGAVQFLARFVNLADELAPLIDLTKKYARFHWSEECERSFTRVKELLHEKLLLRKYDPLRPLGMVTDASDRGIGACIFQSVEGRFEPIEFYAKKLTDAEKKYDVREKEMLAVKRAFDHFSETCRSTHTYVYTDHESLRWMAGSDKGRVQRWSLFLQQYSLTMLYLPGKLNIIADWLSRSVDNTEEAQHEIEVITCPEVWHLQEGNDWWNTGHLKTAPMIPTLMQFVEAYKEDEIPGDLELCDDKLYRYLPSKAGKKDVVYVPKSLREVVLYWFHASDSGGHRGVNATNKRMRNFVGWPGMYNDIRDYVSGCPCRRLLTMGNQFFRGVRGILEAPRPGELISIDFVGPKNWDKRSFHIACVVDHATRYMFNVVTTGCGAVEAMTALKHYVPIFGAPQAVLCDNGAAFIDKEFKQHVMAELRARYVNTSPYYPQGNGINESSHQALNGMIASMALNSSSVPFGDVVRTATMVYNATPHGRLGASPHFAMFGTEMVFPGWQKLTSYPTQETRLESASKVRIQGAVRARLREFESFGVAERRRTLKEGDWVRFKLGEYEKRSHFGSAATTETEKWQPRLSLPCKVESVKSGVVYV